MVKKSFKIFISGILLVMTVAVLPAQTSMEDGIIIPNPSVQAVGGYHSAMTRGLSTLFTNPAGFYRADPGIYFSELTMRLKGPIFDITNLTISALGGGDLTSLLTDETTLNLLSSIYAGFDLVGPISFGYVGNGLGFGIFNVSDVLIESTGPMTLQAKVVEQVVLCGGYSFRIPLGSPAHSLDLGMLLKGTVRGEAGIETSLLALMTLFSSLGLDSVPFDFISAIGIDVGVLYSFRDVFSAGLTCDDLFTPTLTNSYLSIQDFMDSVSVTGVQGLLPLKLNAGVQWTPRLGRLDRFLSDFKLLLDYYDILDFVVAPGSATNPLLHIGFGVELGLLEILSLQGGFNEGLFAAGLALDLTYFRIQASMFGTEAGSEPGLRPVYNLMLGVSFKT